MLGGPARALYADALFALHDLYKDHPLEIPREALVAALTDVLESWAGAASGGALGELDADLLAPGAGDRPDASDAVDGPSPVGQSLSPRDRASAIVRRLVDTGWISVDQRSDYSQFVTLADYAITVLDALARVTTGRETEYQSYVYGTYAQLHEKDVERNGWQAIEVAHRLTNDLLGELKKLLHNIRRYTEQLVSQRRPQDILAAHFLEYSEQVLDRSYHRLKTSDNVHKFRPRILARVDQWLRDPGWIRDVSEVLVRERRFQAQEEAQSLLAQRLHFIRQAYEGMDGLLEEIDRRNTQYARASLEQIRYLLSSSQDTEGMLRDLLGFMAGQIVSGGWARDEEIPAAWRPEVGLQAIRLLEASSLYTPRRASRPHRPAPVERRLVPQHERERARLEMRRRLAEQFTARTINDYVKGRLGERTSMRAAELGVESMRDFVRLIYVAAFAPRRGMDYEVDFEGERVTAAGGRFAFRNVRIRRK